MMVPHPVLRRSAPRWLAVIALHVLAALISPPEWRYWL